MFWSVAVPILVFLAVLGAAALLQNWDDRRRGRG